jgi:hypothetical protein
LEIGNAKIELGDQCWKNWASLQIRCDSQMPT